MSYPRSESELYQNFDFLGRHPILQGSGAWELNDFRNILAFNLESAKNWWKWVGSRSECAAWAISALPAGSELKLKFSINFKSA